MVPSFLLFLLLIIYHANGTDARIPLLNNSEKCLSGLRSQCRAGACSRQNFHLMVKILSPTGRTTTPFPFLPDGKGIFCLTAQNPRREQAPALRCGDRSISMIPKNSRRDTPPGVSADAPILRVGAALAAAHPDMHVGGQGRPQGSPLRALIHPRVASLAPSGQFTFWQSPDTPYDFVQ